MYLPAETEPPANKYAMHTNRSPASPDLSIDNCNQMRLQNSEETSKVQRRCVDSGIIVPR